MCFESFQFFKQFTSCSENNSSCRAALLFDHLELVKDRVLREPVAQSMELGDHLRCSDALVLDYDRDKYGGVFSLPPDSVALSVDQELGDSVLDPFDAGFVPHTE